MSFKQQSNTVNVAILSLELQLYTGNVYIVHTVGIILTIAVVAEATV